MAVPEPFLDRGHVADVLDHLYPHGVPGTVRSFSETAARRQAASQIDTPVSLGKNSAKTIPYDGERLCAGCVIPVRPVSP